MRALAIGLCAALLAGCGAFTEVVVAVNAGDVVVPDDVDAIAILVRDRDADVDVYSSSARPLCRPGGPSDCLTLPVTLSLVPGGDRPDDLVEVQVTALKDTAPVIRDAATFLFTRGQRGRLDLFLYHACVGNLTCAAGPQPRSCGADGQCETPSVMVPGDLAGPDRGGPDDLAGDARVIDAAGAPDLWRPLRRVFLIHDPTTGNLGSLSTVDAICQTQADAARLGGGPYLAVLATRAASAASRFSGTGAAIYTPNGVLVANDNASFFSASHQAVIEEDAGGLIFPPYGVWTGMDAGPTAPSSQRSCGTTEWTDGSSGTFGAPGDANHKDATWSFAGSTVSCNATYRIYCLGVN